MNGGIPPDLSLIINAREGGPNYVYGILTGYVDPPAGFNVQEGLYYNKTFPGHQIHMPQPLRDGTVDYTDGTSNGLDQEAHDVVTFLAWAANPEEVHPQADGRADRPVPGVHDRPDLRGEAPRLVRRRTLTDTASAGDPTCYRDHRRFRPVRHRRAGR